jgi:hypothetical protein
MFASLADIHNFLTGLEDYFEFAVIFSKPSK